MDLCLNAIHNFLTNKVSCIIKIEEQLILLLIRDEYNFAKLNGKPILSGVENYKADDIMLLIRSNIFLNIFKKVYNYYDIKVDIVNGKILVKIFNNECFVFIKINNLDNTFNIIENYNCDSILELISVII